MTKPASLENVVTLFIIGTGWLLDKVDYRVAIPALLICSGVDVWNLRKGRNSGTTHFVLLAASIAAQALI